MKKAFEFLLVLIIFYGVYAAFDNVAPMVFEAPQPFHVVLVSLLVAALLLVLYAATVRSRMHKQNQKNIDALHNEIQAQQELIKQKDQEIKKAQSFKDDVISSAEQTLNNS